jgi:uncharacterized protein YbaP (TraB family)
MARAIAALGLALLFAGAPSARSQVSAVQPGTAPSVPPASSPGAQVPRSTITQAHPALWTVFGAKNRSRVYLLGSIHVLPPQMKWRTRDIDAALKAANVFVFEIPMDASQKTDVQAFIKENGLLPAGTALPSLLNEQTRQDYIAALNATHVPPELLTPMRPWLALLMLNAGMVTQQRLSIDAGLDRQVYAFALKKPGVTFRALETPEQQLKLLMPEDKSLELQEFDAGLKELLNETLSINDLIDAWAVGDVKKLNDLMNSGFKENPKAEKLLFEDRNRAWAGKIEKLLAERHVFFITVGAGHLAGPQGVPALLRAEGYKVIGP